MRPASIARWLGPCAVALAFLALASWSWGRWTDPHVDFGLELYVPWRLLEGETLYGDIAYRHGPLAPYVNALWFALFGVSLRTLVWCNLAILAAIVALTWQLFRRACDRLTATACCLTLLGVFAFSQYVSIGNFNYVTPYQHQQTHGVALSLAMLVALARAPRGRASAWAALAGLCLGLVFLTKAELFVPAALAAAVGVARLGTRGALVAAATAPLAPLAALGLLADARGVLGNWAYLGRNVSDAFYAWGAGLDDPGARSLAAVGAFVGVALFAAAAYGVDRVAPAVRASLGRCAVAALVVFALFWFREGHGPWLAVPRALPLIALAVGVVAATRGPRELLPFAAWAFALLGKMILHARIEHYGFVLAMPATLLAVAAFVHVLPAAVGAGRLARAIGLGAVAAFVAFHLQWAHGFYALRTHEIGTGADALLVADPRVMAREALIGDAIEDLRGRLEPGDTLAALPEGASFNYWLRTPTPSRYLLFLPPEFTAVGGEEPMLADLRDDPPDWIVLVARDPAEFGVGPFGVDPDNGKALMDWVRAGYRLVRRLGGEPFTSPLFGIEILRRDEGGA